jgi:hypothetical protein
LFFIYLLCGKRDRKKAGDKEVKLNGKMRRRPEKDEPSGHPSGALFAANGARTRDALHIADLPRARRLNVKSTGSLAVEPQEVVQGQAEAADGCFGF